MKNNFIIDSNCVALWRMESGALTVDNVNTNTLTNNNTVGEGTSIYKEGSCSAYIASANSNKSLSITDANLATGFPLKNGDTTKIISITLWYYPTSNSAVDKSLIGKWDTNLLSFYVDHTGSVLSVGWATSNTVSDWSFGTIFTFALNNWYHIAVIMDGVNKTCKIRVNGINYTKTYASALNVSTAPLFIGGYTPGGNSSIAGYIDEVAVFNKLLTDSEVDQIRLGIYKSRDYLSLRGRERTNLKLLSQGILPGGMTI